MTLSAGTRLGPYEILSPLGAGGMGEVYRARDARLRREVAIKVLPASFSTDLDRLRRFEQEAQAAGALNHPNITAVYDIGTHEGAPYVVSELLEGETLRAVLAGGRLSPRKAIDFALHISHGLAAAHEKGIIHRDLKPENLFVTKDGRVKILDFGLAKLTRPETTAGPLTGVATETAGTEPGVVMGTVGYMSPEQVKGQPADHRSDIFSFGAVLYEMLTGERAFRGDTPVETMNAILKEDPPGLSGAAAGLEPQLDRILRHSLEKRPNERFQSARDVTFALESFSTTSSAAAATAASRRGRWSRFVVVGLLSLAAAAALIAIFAPRRGSNPSVGRIVRFVTSVPLEYPLAASFGTVNSTAIAFSPDGGRFAYVAPRGESTELQMKVLDQLGSTSLPGTEGARCPFFSPDSQWIGFFSRGKLKKVSLVSGAVLPLAPAGFAWGASWGTDSIVFTPGSAMGIWSVPETGGEPALVAKPDFAKGERSYRFPELLPGGRDILLTVTGGGEPRIAIRSLSTGEQRTLVEGGANAHYAPTGHLLYVRAGALLAVPFDLERRRLNGSPVVVARDVLVDPQTGAAQVTFSKEGTMAYVPGGAQSGRRDLVWIDREGIARPLPPKRTFGAHPNLSPDGRKVAIEITEQGNVDVWLYDLQRDSLTRLTFDAGEDILPTWTPDGRRIVFASNRNGPMDLYWMPADGSGKERPLLAEAGGQMPGSCSPDGRFLAYAEQRVAGFDIWVLQLDEKEKPRPFLETPFEERAPAFSPDGRSIAYVSDETGRDEVYVRPFPGPGEKWRISTEGGTEPVWSRDGKELFFRSGDRMMVVTVRAGASFEARKPAVLFQSRSETDLPFRTFQVSADGGRFLMVRRNEPDSPTMPIVIVLNWFEELRRLVPSGKR